MADIIEPAPSARAKCRACRQPIAKAELRFGEQVPNPYGEGDTHFWYHVRCAALRLPEKLEALINSGVTVDDADQLLKIAQLAQQDPLLPKVMRVDRAPTARARCQRCRKAIDKGMLRVVLERMDEGISSGAGFMHPACAAEQVGRDNLLQRIDHAAPLSVEDEQSLLEALDH